MITLSTRREFLQRSATTAALLASSSALGGRLLFANEQPDVAGRAESAGWKAGLAKAR